MQYLVRRATGSPLDDDNFDGPVWSRADVIAITHFHPKSSSHHPQARAKVLYDDAGIYVMFHVRDQFVLCKRTQPQDPVCRDSCVEAFLQPKADKGYFNFEVNCGGAILLYYVTDPTRTEKGMKAYTPVAPDHVKMIRILHTMPSKIEREIDQPIEWSVRYFVPNEVFEAYVGPLEPPPQRQWRGNFYKCADESSHPHWGSWSPIGEVLNFHVPQYFAPIRFEA